MGLLEAVVELQRRLEAASIPSMVIGGLAVAVWGEPRLTRDADLKVELERESADRLLSVLGSDYRSLQDDPLESLRTVGFAFFEDSTGTRLDLLLADTSFDVAAMGRRRDVELAPGLTAKVCTPEDLIILKLIATRAHDQEDARSVIRRQRAKLDDAYVIRWLREFEQALDDSTLVATYERLRATRSGSR